MRHRETILSLAKEGTVVICANDDSDLPEQLRKETYTGLRTFLETAPKDGLYILLTEDATLSEREMQVIPGGNGRITSRELLSSIIHAGQLSGFSISMQSMLLTFYRLQWVDGSEAAAICLESGFHAASLVMSDKTESGQLEHFAHELHVLLDNENISDGMQYSIINTGTQVISISESLYTTILLFIIGITLLANCLFSFMFGKSKLENRVIFLRWWYTGPLLILLSYGLTFLGKTVITALFSNYLLHPLPALIFKMAFIVIIFLLLCEFRYIIPLAETDYLYAFFMTLSAALDVFIFTSVDMPLLLPFSLFYIVILAARPVKKWWINLILFVLLAFPLVYVLINAMQYFRQDVFASFTASSPLLDFFTSAMLLPYLLMIIRIFVQSGIWDKNKGKKRIIIETSVLSGLLALVIILSATCCKNETPAGSEGGSSEVSASQVSVSDGHAVSLEAHPYYANGMLNFDMTLSSPMHVLRYDISVSSEAAVPLYSANLPFSFSETAGHAVFNLDENPVNPFLVSGTMPSTLPVTIFITAWLKDGSQLLTEEHSVTFTHGTTKSTQPEAVLK